jgi:hypothetical protein
VALLLLTHFSQIITLYEGAHGGLLGGLALTIGQLALLPNIVVWAASWLVGPGFALGTGSGVSPLGTSVGPLPAVPFLGALPTADLPFGFVGLLVPVVAAYVITTLLRPRLQTALSAASADDVLRRVLVGVTTGLTAGVAIGLASWASAGSAGPGRLVDVGPNPWVVGSIAALEVAVPAVLAMVVTPPRFVGGAGLASRASSASTTGTTRSDPGHETGSSTTTRLPREFGTPPVRGAGGGWTSGGTVTATRDDDRGDAPDRMPRDDRDGAPTSVEHPEGDPSAGSDTTGRDSARSDVDHDRVDHDRVDDDRVDDDRVDDGPDATDRLDGLTR